MTPPTIGRRYGALEVLGLGDPLYVTKRCLPLFVPGLQMVDLGRIDDEYKMQPAGKAYITQDEAPRAVFRPGLEEALGYWSAPLMQVKSLVLGLSHDPISLTGAIA